MDQLESVGTTPSHIAVSDCAETHRRSNENSKIGRGAGHGDWAVKNLKGSVQDFAHQFSPSPWSAGHASNPIRPVPYP